MVANSNKYQAKKRKNNNIIAHAGLKGFYIKNPLKNNTEINVFKVCSGLSKFAVWFLKSRLLIKDTD